MSLDPRCFSRTKLEAPSPLPYVSRRALKRVIDAIPIPKSCHYCSGKVVLKPNSEVYGGRSFGGWPYCYCCEQCGAYVSLHPDTDLPTGVLADTVTRDARRVAKLPFMCIVRAEYDGQRNPAYAWLAQQMGLRKEECHFALFDEDDCERVFNICMDRLL